MSMNFTPTPAQNRARSYELGYLAAVEIKSLAAKHIRRLSTDVDYRQGFHKGRPTGLTRLKTCLLEDPTRPGGWCARPFPISD